MLQCYGTSALYHSEFRPSSSVNNGLKYWFLVKTCLISKENCRTNYLTNS
jgi:hypothetical protein